MLCGETHAEKQGLEADDFSLNNSSSALISIVFIYLQYWHGTLGLVHARQALYH